MIPHVRDRPANKQVAAGLIMFVILQTYFDKGILKWESQHPFHAIFGYLEIGKILSAEDIAEKKDSELYAQHPHFANAQQYKKLNSIYVASDQLNDSSLRGSGTFVYNDSLRLTKAGYNKSIWELPGFFGDKAISISRHKNRNRFREIENGKMLLSTVGIGQDFVVDDKSGRVQEWAIEMVESSTKIGIIMREF
jgi:hypothetical protein